MGQRCGKEGTYQGWRSLQSLGLFPGFWEGAGGLFCEAHTPQNPAHQTTHLRGVSNPSLPCNIVQDYVWGALTGISPGPASIFFFF